jgi:BirA family biotin operon repressor/biotin-[acetyl-CoA-carboxylase] ligase
MRFALGPRAAECGYRLAALETIGSTNSEALTRARAGDPGLLWVVSAHQSAGHGRRGRAWQTPAGNLAASLLLISPGEPLPATLGFVAGLAVVEAIEAMASSRRGERDLRTLSRKGRGWAPRNDLRLKWPNDVLLCGAKVSGILLEATTLPAGGNAVAVGIGVNVAHAPTGLPYPETSLAAAGIAATAEDLFDALSDAWLDEMARWDGGGGFPAVRSRWLDRAIGVGEPIVIDSPAGQVRGVFETLDPAGRLRVRTADGVAHSITAGDVHFGAAAIVEA